LLDFLARINGMHQPVRISGRFQADLSRYDLRAPNSASGFEPMRSLLSRITRAVSSGLDGVT
jgi:hypothetical protein